MKRIRNRNKALFKRAPKKNKNTKNTSSKLKTALGDIFVGSYIRANKSLIKKRIAACVIPRFSNDSFKIYIRKDPGLKIKEGNLVVCTVKEIRGNNIFAEITENLGEPDSPGMDLLALVKQNGWETEFSHKSLEMAARADRPVTPNDKLGRKDFTKDLIITIDSEDTRDFDDAVGLKVTDYGYELAVHIADVANYVQEGSAIDRDALKKCVSLYLPDRTYPMLPERLSNGICSLIENEERLTLSCVMKIDRTGHVISYDLYEGYISVFKRMTYKEVDHIIKSDTSFNDKDHNSKNVLNKDHDAENALNKDHNGESALNKEYPDELIQMLFNMYKLSRLLKEKRIKDGAVDFNIPKNTVKLDCYGTCVDVLAEPSYISGSIIEEFMLLANECVSNKYRLYGIPFLYRIHEKPVREKVEDLISFLDKKGYGFPSDPDNVSSRDYARLLKEIKGSKDEKVISMLALLTMSQAVYFDEPVGHFALSKADYSHFTSPIRRYPDLQIHRIIHDDIRGRLNEKRINDYSRRLGEVAIICSTLERKASDIERKALRIKEAQYMRSFMGEEFDGIISGITGWGFYVEMSNKTEGLVHVKNLKDDHYEHDEKSHILVGIHTGKIYSLGDEVRVRVMSVNDDMGQIDLKLVN